VKSAPLRVRLPRDRSVRSAGTIEFNSSAKRCPPNGRPLPWRPNALPWRPDALPWRPNALPWRPNALPWRPNALPRRPNALPWRPNALPPRPNALPPRPNAFTRDQSMGSRRNNIEMTKWGQRCDGFCAKHPSNAGDTGQAPADLSLYELIQLGILLVR